MELGTTSPTPTLLLGNTPETEYESRISNLNSTPTQCTTEYFSWRQLTDLSEKIPELVEQFGSVTASCMADCVALGTDNGTIVVMDYLGRVKSVLGSQVSSYGSVSALSFSSDYASLVAGYSQGFVAVWDWAKGTTVSVSRPLQPGDKPDAIGHPAGTAVTGVHFVGNSKHRYISCSAGGSVFYHHIVRRLLTTMNTTRLSSASGGPGILFEAAPLPGGTYACEADEMGLVAVLTSGSLIIFKTKNGVEQLYRVSYQQPALSAKAASGVHSATKCGFTKQPYSGSTSWLPALKFKRAATAIDPSERHYSLPRLVYTWGPNIYVLSVGFDRQVAENGASMVAGKTAPRIKFERTLEWVAVEDVVFCRWVDTETLLYMTRSQRIFVFETTLHQETEICLSPPKAIAGRPWVTMATGIEAEPSYAQVVSVYKRRTFALCGVSSVYTGRLLSWVERLALLVDQGQLIDAITLATGLYRGHTGQVVIGLPKTQRDGDAHEKKRQTMVGGKLVELMRGSLGLMFGGSDNELEPGSYQRQHEHWQRSDSEIRALISVCVEACLETENTALLFGDIFERYSASSSWQRIFLETIEPFIISGKIQRLPPQILNAMVDRYGGTPQLVRRLGEILSSLHLNQGDFDIDRVLSSCRQHGLWRTFARVWLGMGDPIAPVHCMIDAATKSSKDTESTHETSWASFKDVRDSDEAPDTVVFDYMDMVIRGRFYPDGQPIKPQGRAEKYSTLITELVFPPVDTSRNPENIRKSYRTLLALLDLDAERLLHTLKRVLSDPFIDFINLIIKPADTGKAVQYSDRSLRRASQVKSFPQIVVDTLFVLTTASGTSDSATPLTKRQIGLLSSFALTLYATRFPLIFLRDDRVTEWTDVLLRLDDTSTLSEREYAFELLFKLNPPRSYADCIGRVRQAGFFRVLERIYCAVEQYGMALQTYLDHPDYAYHRAVFAAIRELAASKGDMVLADITEFVRSQAVELVETDAKNFVDTVESVGFLEHATIFDALGSHPQAQFAYLRALLDPTPDSLSRSPECLCMLPASAVSDERAPPNIGLSDEQHIVIYPFQSLVPDSSHKTNKYPQRYHERYLELMCQFNPGSVLQYLKQHVDLSPEPFRLSYVQAVCGKHGVSDGLVWALVRLGDFSGALDTLLAQTDQEVESVKAAVPVGDAANGELGSLGEADRERLLDHLDIAARNIGGCVDVCKAALAKLGKDVAAQSAQYISKPVSGASRADAEKTQNAAARARSDYQAMVGAQLCDLWLALLRRVLAYLHGTGQTIDGLPVGSPAETREAWLLVSKRQRWMLHSALDVLISAASPASSLISLRHIIQQLLASGTAAPAESAPPGGVRSLDIAEIQHLLAVAVSAYKTEAQLMVLTNVLVDYDLFTTLGQLVRSQKQGWFVPPDTAGTSADTGSALAKRDVGSLRCGKCSDQLFVDRRQDRAMADRRKQMAQYFETSSMRVIDLHVFEDPAAQWQWIKLRNAAANCDESRSKASSGSSSGSQKRIVLFKCGHGFHRGCLSDAAKTTKAGAGGTAGHQVLSCLRCGEP